MAIGIFAVFGSRSVHFSGAGPLGVLTIAFVAALCWRKEISPASEVYTLSILYSQLSFISVFWWYCIYTVFQKSKLFDV